jgi:hypothetical protein
MSYDLMVFEPSAAPGGREAFLQWFEVQTQWSEQHAYNDPARTSEGLRRWYESVSREFPNMNPLNAEDVDDDHPRLTDYSIGRDVIYAAFPWSEAENAYDTVRNAAVEAGVGFYDVSGDEGDGEIHLPGQPLRAPSQGAWRKIAAEFGEFSSPKGGS